MNLTLMYHQINIPGEKFGVLEFTKHLEYLVKNFIITTPNAVNTTSLMFRNLDENQQQAQDDAEAVLPDLNVTVGSNLEDKKINGDEKFSIFGSKKKTSICLTFDDAYYDFYCYVYPLLVKHNIQAILGIPTAYIRKKSTLDASKRLEVSYPAGLEKNNLQYNTPLCTWTEIKEMVKSGHVIPASHSHMHCDLTSSKVNLKREIVHSKKILEKELNCKVNSFIYPFGKMNKKIHNFVKEHYDYIFRIGSASNKNWNNIDKLYYRIDANHIWPKTKNISRSLIRKFKLKYFLNKLRSK